MKTQDIPHPHPEVKLNRLPTIWTERLLGKVFVPEPSESADQGNVLWPPSTVPPRECALLSPVCPPHCTLCVLSELFQWKSQRPDICRETRARFPRQNELGQRKIMQANNCKCKILFPHLCQWVLTGSSSGHTNYISMSTLSYSVLRFQLCIKEWFPRGPFKSPLKPCLAY